MIAIPDPDVVFTDLGLAALGGYLGWRLWRAGRPGVVLMVGLASAAFWGAVFHALFPDKTATPAGFAVWLCVAFSIAVVAESVLDMTLSVVRARRNLRRAIVSGYCVLFVAIVLFVDESFSTIVRLYAPALTLGILVTAAVALRERSRSWALVALGLTLSAAAALLQQARVAVHPVYFDHNAVYHVVQAGALVILYLGFRQRAASVKETS